MRAALPRAPAAPLEPYARFLETSYFPALDGLRCVAICAVLWHHALPRPREGWLGLGHTGVPLFFALSGFLITSRLLAERRTTGDISLGRFWLRRSLRIFPLYYAVLAGFALYLGWRTPDAGSRHFFAHFWQHASYTSNWLVDYAVPHPVWFGFAWSLATEEQFYAWWPPVLRGCSRLGAGRAVFGGLAVLLAVLVLQQLAERHCFAAWLPPGALGERVLRSLAPALSLGAVLSVLAHERRSFAWLWALFGKVPGLSAWAIVLALCGWLARPGSALWLDLTFVALVGSAVLGPRSWLARALASWPLVQVGRVSYGIYLFHVPVLGLLRRAAPSLVELPGALFLLALAGSGGLATLSHRYFEAPLLALAKRPLSTRADRSRGTAVLACPHTE